MPTETAPLEFRIELDQQGSDQWTPTLLITSPSFPKGKNELRVPMSQSWQSRDEALKQAIYQFGSTLAEQVGSTPQMNQ